MTSSRRRRTRQQRVDDASSTGAKVNISEKIVSLDDDKGDDDSDSYVVALLQTRFPYDKYEVPITADLVFAAFAPYGPIRRILIRRHEVSSPAPTKKRRTRKAAAQIPRLEAIVQYGGKDHGKAVKTAVAALHGMTLYAGVGPFLDLTFRLQATRDRDIHEAMQSVTPEAFAQDREHMWIADVKAST